MRLQSLFLLVELLHSFAHEYLELGFPIKKLIDRHSLPQQPSWQTPHRYGSPPKEIIGPASCGVCIIKYRPTRSFSLKSRQHLRPVRNFSRPFYIQNNQEYNCKDIEEGTPRSSSSHKHTGLVAEVGIFETSLDRGTAIADAQSVAFPTQAKIDRKHSDPWRTGALNVVQHAEFADERSTDGVKQPSTPSLSASQNILTTQTMPSIGSPSVQPRGSEALALKALVQTRNRDETLRRTIPGLCNLPDCPIQQIHYNGIYLYRNYPIPSQGPFGVSNPPPFIWAACYRLLERKEKPEDFTLFWGFKRYHKANSWEGFLRPRSGL